MRVVRSTLCILYVMVGLPILMEQMSRGRGGLLPLFHMRVFDVPLLVEDLFLSLCGTLFPLAAISYWRRWRWAKTLCILVSALNVAVVVFINLMFWWYGHGNPKGLEGMEAATAGVGVLGMVAFGLWNPALELAARVADRAVRKGDGTWEWLNRSHVVVEYAGFFAIWSWLDTWAWKGGLPTAGTGGSILWVMLAAIAVVTVHEGGHALCGLLLGHRLQAFFAGPFHWRRMEGRWKFALKAVDFINIGGGAAVAPQRLHEPRWKDMCISAAGPGVNLVTGPVALWIAGQMTHGPWMRYWFPVAAFGAISLMTAAFNLVPVRAGMQYSDGARLYQAFRGGVWYDMTQIFRTVTGTVVTGLRPRDMDMDAIRRVLEAGIVTGPQELWMHLAAHSYYVDRAMDQLAGEEMRAAQALYEQHEQEIAGVLLSSFVIDEAVVRRDAAKARQWWDRMTQKKPPRANGDYWMAESALCWVEGRRDEAQAAWRRAEEWLRRMPEAGTYAFDRDQLAKLKQVIDTASPGGAPETVQWRGAEPEMV